MNPGQFFPPLDARESQPLNHVFVMPVGDDRISLIVRDGAGPGTSTACNLTKEMALALAIHLMELGSQ